MTLREFLKMNTNGLLLDVYIYDNQNAYVMCEEKRFFLNKGIFLDKKVLSFELDCDGLCIKLDF